MILFSGSSNLGLAQKLSKEANFVLGKIDISSFPNHELRIKIQENVKNKTCVVLQSLSKPVERHLLESALIVDALIRADAQKVIIIIPWLGYSFQDKVFTLGEPISAKVVSNIISNSGISRVILLDLHNDSIAGFFSVPAITLESQSLFLDYVKKENLNQNSLVVSPDFGAMKKARSIAKILNLPQVYINKERNLETGQVTAHGISHPVKGKTALVFDDMISTGGTVVEATKILKKEGAGKVIFFATHALLVGDAIKKLEESLVDQVVVTDSVAIPQEKPFKKLKILSLAPLLAEFLS